MRVTQFKRGGMPKKKQERLHYCNFCAKSQMEVNKAEAQAGGLLNQWRPALGWVCVSAYAYNFVIMPMAIWAAKMITGDAPPMVALDTTELGVLLAGMLGIGSMRSYDKTHGVAPK